MKPKPVAVLISDIHFTPATLELASSALRQAMAKALELGTPVVLAGDTLDTKSIIRAECANRLIEIMSADTSIHKVVLVGNHDLLNEKGKAHSLNFLRPFCDVIEHPVYDRSLGAHLIPYQTSLGELQLTLAGIEPGSRIICHQGVHGAAMGHYVQDKTSISADAFADFRTISGHYHKRQDIKAGRPRKGAVGLFSYIGNPYSLSFGEANDGPKGFQVLMSDGSLDFVPTNFRKHVILEIGVGGHPSKDMLPGLMYPESLGLPQQMSPEDLLWIKLKGPHDVLSKLKKSDLSKTIGRTDFKLDKLYTDQPALERPAEALTDAQLMDEVIEAGDDTAEAKAELRTLWRGLV